MQLACFLLGHAYLPARKVVKSSDGVEREVECLKCSRCGEEHRFIFDNWRHTLHERAMWRAAEKRANVPTARRGVTGE